MAWSLHSVLIAAVLTCSAAAQGVRWMEWASSVGCACGSAERSHYGLHELHVSWELTRAAAQHAAWMASRRELRHQQLYGLRVWTGSVWLSVIGENVAFMSSAHASRVAADSCMQWLHSSAHRANVLSAGATHCGVGFAVDQYGSWWAAQLLAYHSYAGSDFAVRRLLRPSQSGSPLHPSQINVNTSN